MDPSFNSDAIAQILKDHNLSARYVINTHEHMDHTVGNKEIKSMFGTKVVAHQLSTINQDISVAEGDILRVGTLDIRIIHTPGHSPDSICLLVDGRLLTGDTLFVGECGRTDLEGGNAEDMYHSLFDKLMKLDDKIKVYPGHDYGKTRHSTIGLERKNNYTLANRTLDEFIEFMKEP